MAFKSFTGTPAFLQGQSTPSGNEPINQMGFDSGILTFFYDRTDEALYWLTETNGSQSWAATSPGIDIMAMIGILPALQRLYWFTSDSDSPTSTEEIPDVLLTDVSYGLLWWNRASKLLFKMTAYDAGTQQQTWTQIFSGNL